MYGKLTTSNIEQLSSLIYLRRNALLTYNHFFKYNNEENVIKFHKIKGHKNDRSIF